MKAVTSCGTHKIDQQETDGTRQINNTGYEWYIGSLLMQSPGALDRVSMICLMHDTRHLS